jgi:protein ImuB
MMSAPSSRRRYLSVWLRRLATDRIARLRSGAPPELAPLAQAPLVVALQVKNALQVAAMNDAAARLGLRAGMALADAKAMYPALTVVDADPDADRILLEAIADWCDRYTPLIGLDPPDGLMLDITGCAHLFGGEAAFCGDIVQRLGLQRFAARAAIADTVGCAWAVARYGDFSHPPLKGRAIACDRHEGTTFQTPSPRSRGEGRGEGAPPQAQTRGEAPSPGASRRPLPASGERWRMQRRSATCDCPAVSGGGDQRPYAIVPPGGVREALLPLRLAALRIAGDIEAALGQAGLKCIADVIDRPRAPLAARFGEEFIRRIDQAVGREDEPITPRLPVPPYVAERRFADPILLESDVLRTIELLAQELARMLERRGEGARRLQVALFRTDGKVCRSELGTGAPLRDPARIRALFAERLAAVGEACDPGFGFDVVRLAALTTERCDPVQTGLASPDHTAELAHLVDRLGARFGLRRVTRPVPQDSHIPEFAVAAVAAHGTREKFVIRHGASLPRPAGERVGRGGHDDSVSHRRSPPSHLLPHGEKE